MGDKGEPKSCVWLWTLPSPAQASKGEPQAVWGAAAVVAGGGEGCSEDPPRTQQTQTQAEGSWPVV